MSIGTIMPTPVQQFFDNNGKPLAGGLLYVYDAGTNSLSPIYADVTLTTPLTNPVVLDAAGRAQVYLDAASYKFVLKTPLGVTIWTADNITATHVNGANLGQIKFIGGDRSSPMVGETYPVGASFDKLHPGTATLSIDSADLVGSYVIEAMLMAPGGGFVTAALVNLSDAPDTPIVTLTSNSEFGARVQSGVIPWAAAGVSKEYGIKVKGPNGGTLPGYAWGISLMRIS
jgi:hypothetical protein